MERSGACRGFLDILCSDPVVESFPLDVVKAVVPFGSLPFRVGFSEVDDVILVEFGVGNVDICLITASVCDGNASEG